MKQYLINPLSSILFPLSCLAMSLNSYSDSDIKVTNFSNVEIQAIWQAGGCANIVEDWEGDNQYTVCSDQVMPPGKRHTHTFGSLNSDRSVKVFSRQFGVIGYCNSMDDESIDVYNGSEPGTLRVETNC